MTKPKKPFRPGDAVLVTVRSGTGSFTEQPATVKEMAGARNVCVVVHGRDRILQVADCRHARNHPELHVPDRRALSATLGESVAAKVAAPKHFEPKTPDTRPATIGDLMQRERTERGMSQELMARMLRIEKAKLVEFENNGEMPGDDVVLRFADVLDVPLDMLLAGVDVAKRLEASVGEVLEFSVSEAFERIETHVALVRRFSAALFDVDEKDVNVDFSHSSVNGWGATTEAGVGSVSSRGKSVEAALQALGIEVLQLIQKECASRESHIRRMRAQLPPT